MIVPCSRICGHSYVKRTTKKLEIQADDRKPREFCNRLGLHSYVNEIPGLHAQGQTVRETAENVLDALKELLAYW